MAAEVKILDFGIARADGTRAATATGTVLGTAAYLSPEQASGPAGPQSDLYSLGCVLFEMLSGRPPFTADSAVGLAYRQVHDDPGPPSAWRPGLPAGLDHMVALSCSPRTRRPGRRSAAAARADLLATSPSGERRNSERRYGRTPCCPGHGAGARPGWRPRPARDRARPSRSPHRCSPSRWCSNIGRLQPPPAPDAPRTPRQREPGSVRTTGSALPPAAAAAAALVGDLKAGVTAGQVTQQAGQNLFNQLQQVLFPPPGQSGQQLQQQYSQLVQAYTQDKSQGQITGQAVAVLSGAISALGAALGTL